MLPGSERPHQRAFRLERYSSKSAACCAVRSRRRPSGISDVACVTCRSISVAAIASRPVLGIAQDQQARRLLDDHSLVNPAVLRLDDMDARSGARPSARARGCGRAVRVGCTSTRSRRGRDRAPHRRPRCGGTTCTGWPISAKNQSRPRPASPCRARGWRSGSIASPEPHDPLGCRGRSARTGRGSRAGMVLGLGDDRAERRRRDRSLVDQAHQRRAPRGSIRSCGGSPRLGRRCAWHRPGRGCAAEVPGRSSRQSGASRARRRAGSRSGASARRPSWRSGSRAPTARARPGR